MKAIILEAGSKYQEIIGKMLCSGFSEAETSLLLHTQVDSLHACGITEIIIVRSVGSNMINLPGIIYYDNGSFSTTGNLYSLMLVESEMAEEVIILYADIYYDESAIRTLMQSTHPIVLATLIGCKDSVDTNDYDKDRFIELIDLTSENRVFHLGKQTLGELHDRVQFTGIIKLTKQGCQQMLHFLKYYKFFHHENCPQSYTNVSIVDLFACMINCGVDVRAIAIETGWLQIDSEKELERLFNIKNVKQNYEMMDTDWGVRSQKYNNLDWVNKDELLCALDEYIGEVTPETSLLDVGTGTGKVLVYLKLKRGNANYHGLDISAEMLEKIDPGYQFNLALGDVRHMEKLYESCLFDYVIARMVFHHVDELDKAMQQVYRVLKYGGKFLICEGNPPSYASINFYKEVFYYKEPRNIFMESDLINLLYRNNFCNLNTRTVILNGMSLNNWVENSGLPKRNRDIIKKLHYECEEEVKMDYRMKVDADDIKMDWKFSIITGQKK